MEALTLDIVEYNEEIFSLYNQFESEAQTINILELPMEVIIVREFLHYYKKLINFR